MTGTAQSRAATLNCIATSGSRTVSKPRFLSGEGLQAAITDLLREPGLRCAVAFWGEGSQNLVGAGAKIICNLKAGGTNPFALRRLAKADIRQSDRLHAKVYIGKTRAIIGSANASANGLGLEGAEQSAWIEAGIETADLGGVIRWFQSLWDDSSEISEADWRAAQEAWIFRQGAKPTRLSFASFNENGTDLPLLTWIGSNPWEACAESVADQLGFFDDALKRRIDDGIEVGHPDDERLMKGKWVLCWKPKRDGQPRAKATPYWVHLSDVIVRGGFRYLEEREPRDVVLASERFPPEPFDPKDARFNAAFREVLALPEYALLRALEYDEPWFADRSELVRQFWRDLKAEYLRSRPASSAPRS